MFDLDFGHRPSIICTKGEWNDFLIFNHWFGYSLISYTEIILFCRFVIGLHILGTFPSTNNWFQVSSISYPQNYLMYYFSNQRKEKVRMRWNYFNESCWILHSKNLNNGCHRGTTSQDNTHPIAWSVESWCILSETSSKRMINIMDRPVKT